MRTLAAAALAPLIAAGCSSKTVTPDAPDAPRGPDALVAAVDPARIEADLVAITGPRAPGSAHWQEVQDLCATRLEALGFTVERHAYATGVNVIGVLPGATLPGERVLVSAHYDSTNACAGADDNGSGVAGVLEAARVLALAPHARTLVAACWDEEERGLIGSSAYVERAAAAGDAIAASFVFEMIGYRSTEPNSQTTDPGIALAFPAQEQAIAANDYRGDFLLVIHDDLAAAPVADLEAAAVALGLPTITLPVSDALKSAPQASGLRRSDHAPFWAADYPAIQLTDTANYRNPHYHCGGGPDVLADIDLPFTTLNVQVTVAALARTLDR